MNKNKNNGISISIDRLFDITPYEEKIERISYKRKINEIIDDFLNKTDWRIYENANRAVTYYSLLSHIVQHAIAIYSLDKLPKKYAYGHKTGWWHIHDLGISGIFIRYCSGLDMQKFLLDGFKPVLPNTAISNPPKHFSTVLDHLLNFFTIFSHECAGAVSVASLDIYSAPYIKMDRIYYSKMLNINQNSKEMDIFMRNYVYQSLQRFVWNLNYPLRAGFEALFTNITLDLSAKKSGLADRNCIWDGKIIDNMKYGDLQEEVNLFNECLFEIKSKGQPNGNLFTFPIITINVTEDFDEILSDNLKELIYECSAKYGEFYFQNCVNGEVGLKKIDPGDVRSMAFLPEQKFFVMENNKVNLITVKDIYEKYSNGIKLKVLYNGKFVDIIGAYEIDYKKYDNYVSISLENGISVNVSYDHTCVVARDMEIKEIYSQNVKPGDYFLLSTEYFNGDNGNDDDYLKGYFIGTLVSCGAIFFNVAKVPLNSYLLKNIGKLGIRYRKIKSYDLIDVAEIEIENCKLIDNYLIKDGYTFKFNNKIYSESYSFRKGIYDSIRSNSLSNDYIFSTMYYNHAKSIMVLLNTIGIKSSIKFEDDLQCFTVSELDKTKILFDNEEFYLVKVENVELMNNVYDKVYDFTVDTDKHWVELPEGIITHQCCRLNLDKTEIYRRVGGMFSGGENVGSICVTTINLPRIGYVARNFFAKDKNNINEILNIIDNIINEEFDVIIDGMVKRKSLILEHSTKKYNLAPFIKAYENPNMPTYFITVGFVGLNECLINMGLKGGLADYKNIEYGEKIMNMLLDNVKKYQEKYDTLINLEATPAEGAGTRLAKLDKKYFWK